MEELDMDDITRAQKNKLPYVIINTKIFQGTECILFRHRDDKNKFAIKFGDEISYHNRAEAHSLWHQMR